MQALYLSEMSAVIRDMGGVTEKYTGDGVLGLFGTESDTTGNTDASRAVQAALWINLVLKRSLNPVLRELGLPEIGCGQGVDYGPVYIEKVGLRGENQFSLAGPTVSLAAKMQGVSPAGGITIGRDVYNRLPSDWQKYATRPPQAWSYPYEAFGFTAAWSE